MEDNKSVESNADRLAQEMRKIVWLSWHIDHGQLIIPDNKSPSLPPLTDDANESRSYFRGHLPMDIAERPLREIDSYYRDTLSTISKLLIAGNIGPDKVEKLLFENTKNQFDKRWSKAEIESILRPLEDHIYAMTKKTTVMNKEKAIESVREAQDRLSWEIRMIIGESNLHRSHDRKRLHDRLMDDSSLQPILQKLLSRSVDLEIAEHVAADYQYHRYPRDTTPEFPSDRFDNSDQISNDRIQSLKRHLSQRPGFIHDQDRKNVLGGLSPDGRVPGGGLTLNKVKKEIMEQSWEILGIPKTEKTEPEVPPENMGGPK